MDSAARLNPQMSPRLTSRRALRTVVALQAWCPRQDSNLRSRLRRAVLYPLSYGGMRSRAYPTDRPRPVQLGGANGWAPRWVISWAMYLLSAPCEATIFSARLRTWGVSACCAAYWAIGTPP